MAENENGRPGKGSLLFPTPTKNVGESTSNRCLACGSRISAPESIRTGYGRDCRRRLLSLLAEGKTPEPARRVSSSVVTDEPVVDLIAVREAVSILRAVVDVLDAALGGAR